ncbi:MAG: inositol monophosphatase [Rubritalea sp.]|tara:strand:- start:3994 stop:4803 length:810 start_codon:yes stop_codon:yes gene_type:complete
MEFDRDAVRELVVKVGEFQLKYFRSMKSESTEVKSLRETVSFVDVESEKLLMDGLMPLVSGAGFYGEESGKSGSQDLVWIVDPLDGTTNFLSGLDHFSVSVALVKNGKSIFGIVYKPFSGETYEGELGKGVRYNGELMTARMISDPSEALFLTGFPYRSPDRAEGFFKAAAKILTLGRGIRRSGSAALDVAQLSLGWVQGFWETDLQPYDIAAGLIMLSENGIIVTNEHGEDLNMFTDTLMVAAQPAVHAELLERVRSGYCSGNDPEPA